MEVHALVVTASPRRASAEDDGRRDILRADLRAVIVALARDAEVSDAYVREGLGCLRRLRAVCAGGHEGEYDAFLLGAVADSKVENPDWEDALAGQEPFAGGAPAAPDDDGPDTQSFDGGDKGGDDVDDEFD